MVESGHPSLSDVRLRGLSVAQLDSVLGLIVDFAELVYMGVMLKPKSVRVDYIDTGSRLRSVRIGGAALALALGDVVTAVPDRRDVGIIRAVRSHDGGKITAQDPEDAAVYVIESSVLYRTAVIRDTLGWIVGLDAARAAVVDAIGVDTQCDATETEDGIQWHFLDSDGRQCLWRITKLSALIPGCTKFKKGKRNSTNEV